MTTAAWAIGLNLLGVGLHRAGLPASVEVSGMILLAVGMSLSVGRVVTSADVSGQA